MTPLSRFLPGHVYLQRQMTGVTSVSTGTYRETSIVPTSCTKHTQRGAVQGTQGAWGHRGHILYTKLKHTCFTSYRKKTEAWRRQREKGGREEGFGLIFKYKRTCKNRIASRHCAPIFTVIETGSGTTPWQHHPFQICRLQGRTVKRPSQRHDVWHKNQCSLRGWG